MKEKEIMNVKMNYDRPQEGSIEAPVWKARRGLNYIPYGSAISNKRRDDYPERLIYLKQNSSINQRCIRLKAKMTAGNGFLAKDNDQSTLDFLEEISSDGDANEMLDLIADDLETFGGFALEVIWSTDWKKISKVNHINFPSVRSGIVNGKGKVDTYYHSFDWSNQRSVKKAYAAFNPDVKENVERFNNAMLANEIDAIKEIASEPHSQILHWKPKNTPGFYYPIPEYVGSIKDIETDISNSEYANSTMKNGMTIGKHINIVGNFTPDQRKIEAQNIINNNRGAKKAGDPLITFSQTKDESVQVSEPKNDSSESRYTAINSSVVQSILTAHGITSPLLIGRALPGALGNRDELLNTFELFYVMTIKDEQKKITKVFNKFMKINGLKPLSIDRLNVFEDMNSENNNNEIKTNNE